jgi:hypothetical protein
MEFPEPVSLSPDYVRDCGNEMKKLISEIMSEKGRKGGKGARRRPPRGGRGEGGVNPNALA